MFWITSRDPVMSKLMQSTATMITRFGAADTRPLATVDGPSSLVSVRICSAETTRRRRPLIVTVNFSGPRFGTGWPVLSITCTSTATTSTLTRIRPGAGS